MGGWRTSEERFQEANAHATVWVACNRGRRCQHPAHHADILLLKVSRQHLILGSDAFHNQLLSIHGQLVSGSGLSFAQMARAAGLMEHALSFSLAAYRKGGASEE